METHPYGDCQVKSDTFWSTERHVPTENIYLQRLGISLETLYLGNFKQGQGSDSGYYLIWDLGNGNDTRLNQNTFDSTII